MSVTHNKKLPLLLLLVGAALIAFGWSVSRTTETEKSGPDTLTVGEETTGASTESLSTVSPKATPVVQPDGRFLGDKNAPIQMIEYSSLTCSHCAHFHTNILNDFRIKYVDTGKVRIEFRSFPLNQPALDGMKLLNCLPEEQYYPFMSMLFETQSNWAFSKDYKDILKQNAKLAGLSDDKIDSCLNDKGAEEKLVAGLVEEIKKYDLQSTPTFILNDGAAKLVGAGTLADFDREIEKLLSAPAATQDEKPAVTTEDTPAP